MGLSSLAPPYLGAEARARLDEYATLKPVPLYVHSRTLAHDGGLCPVGEVVSHHSAHPT